MKNRFSLPDICLTFSLSVLLSYGLSQTLVIPYTLQDMLLPVLVLTLVCSLFFAFPFAALGSGILLAGTALFVLLTDLREEVYLFYEDFSYWSMHWEPNPLLDALTLWGIAAAVLFPVFLLVRYRAPTPILLVTGVILYYGLDLLGSPVPDWLLWCFFALVLLQTAYNGHVFRRKAGLFLLCCLPFCALLPFLASFVETRNEGLGQDFIETLSERFGFIAVSSTKPGTLRVTDVGAELGGPYQPTGLEVLRYELDTVLSLHSERGPYLRGGLGQNYTGRRWDAPGGEDAILPSPAETVLSGALRQPLLYALLSGQFGHDNAFLNPAIQSYFAPLQRKLPRRSRITHLAAAGSRMYLPYDAYLCSTAFPGALTMSENALLSSGYILGENIFYDVDIILPAEEYAEPWRELLRTGRQGLDEEHIEPLREAFESLDMAWLGDPFDEEGKRRYRDYKETLVYSLFLLWVKEGARAYDAYLQLPERLPERVRSLARQLAVYDNDYDNAVAIEKYLSRNYRYNIDMEPTPRGEDFVDYFLFTQKEGYCTYFASAMAVLCRAAGIPARYVEGFAPAPKNGDGEIIYTDEQAHAWTEAYIGGFGWIAFEPTSGFTSTHNLPPASPTQIPEASVTPPPPPSPTPENDSPSPTPAASQGAAPEERKPLPGFVVLLFNIIAALLPFVLLRIALRARRRRFLARLHAECYDRAQVLRLKRHVAFLLRAVHLKPKPEETGGEYAVRAQLAWPLEGDQMQRLFALFARDSFSPEPLSTEESAALRELTLSFERYAPLYLGRFRMFMYRKVFCIL